MVCRFMHKDCKADCNNHECRAFFPEKQPLIDPKSKDICLGDEYETECLQYMGGVQWREERHKKGLTEKCPFATNNRCGRSWEWRCDAEYPFALNPYEIREGTADIPVRGEDKNPIFLKVNYDINETCLSGNPKIYTICPHYKAGVLHREYVRELKKKE